MRKKLVAGFAVLASAGLGAFAATGFGDQGVGDLSVQAVTVKTQKAKAPPPEAATAAPAARATLFRVIYKSTQPVEIPAGYSSVRVGSCPRGGGVLSGWFKRTGSDQSGLADSGGGPDGARKWSLIVNNTTGAATDAKFGMVCLKG